MKWKVWYDVQPLFWYYTPETNLILTEKEIYNQRYFEVSWNSAASGSIVSGVSNKMGGEFTIGIGTGELQDVQVYLDGQLEETLTSFPTYASYDLNKTISQVKLVFNPVSTAGFARLENLIIYKAEGFEFEVNPSSVSILPYESRVTQIPTTSEPAIALAGKLYPSISFEGILTSHTSATNFYQWAKHSVYKIARLFTDESVYDGILTKFTGQRLPKSSPSYYVEFSAEFLVTSVVSGVEEL